MQRIESKVTRWKKWDFDRQRWLDIFVLMGIHSFAYHIRYIYLRHPTSNRYNLDAEAILKNVLNRHYQQQQK